MLFSGMSTSVVTPPAAAARVAVAKPSHSVRPGLVDVDVRVDQPRQQHHVVAELDDLGGRDRPVEAVHGRTTPSRTVTVTAPSARPPTARGAWTTRSGAVMSCR